MKQLNRVYNKIQRQRYYKKEQNTKLISRETIKNISKEKKVLEELSEEELEEEVQRRQKLYNESYLNIPISSNSSAPGSGGGTARITEQVEELPVNTVQVLLDLRVTSENDVIKDGSDNVETWINYGVAGSDPTQPIVASQSTFDLANNKLDFVRANGDNYTFSTIELNGDTGYSIMVGYRKLTNDSALFSSTNEIGFNTLSRASAFNVGYNSMNSRIFPETAEFNENALPIITEITHLGADNGMIVIHNNSDTNRSTGNAGVPLDDITHFENIGGQIPSRYWNGEIAFVYIQNRPFTQVERDKKYAEYSAIYPPA